MYTQKRINNQRFTVRFCGIAKYLGFTRVGPFEKLLRQMHPQNKLSMGNGYARVERLLREIEEFKKGNREWD